MKDNNSLPELNGTTTAPIDVDKLKKREELFNYLNIAAQELARTRDYRGAIEKISQLIVPKFATWFSIDLLVGDRMEELILAHEEPQMISWARKYREAYPIDLQSDSGTAKVVKTGAPSFFPEVTNEMILASIRDPDQLEAVLNLNIKSVITVALFDCEVITGVISFISSKSGQFYDDIDLMFAQNLANHIGLALENARLNEQLKASERKLEQMLTELPAKVIFFRGEALIVETINEIALETWNRKKEEVIGKSLLQILPELNGQPFPEQLKQVFNTGIGIAEKEILATLNLPGGGVKRFYNDYYYQPLTDNEGKRIGVLATSVDTTDKVKNREQLQKNENDLQASNEELSATNEELAETQQHLQELLQAVTESEAKFKNIIYQAPVAMAIFKGPEFIIDVFNEKVLEYWGRTANEVAGLPLFKVLPESGGQGFEKLLNDVLETGERFIANEMPVTLRRNGLLEMTWINFVYDPLKSLNGKVEGIIVVCNEVTEQVNSRRQLEQAYEQARLSKEAAQLGTFDMDMDKGTMEWDERCRTLFGISHQEKVSYENDFVNGLHPDDRQRILNIIADEVMNQSVSNGKYDVEYRTVGAADQNVRWVRAKGQVYFNTDGIPKRFIGSVLDITEQKQDEQRKSDFIGMVSHELKTPLTSLTAIMQVMNGKLKNSPDGFLADAAGRANIQIKKMTSLINGFLNISRLESGKIALNKQLFELNELIKECIEEAQHISSGHTVTLYPCLPINVYADREKIGSVLSNLLSNAVKYSPKGKMIEVKCAVIGKLAQISIKDEGMGIKQGELHKLFDRYYRVQSEYTRHISGFGIGLYLSAEIIQRHEGKIWAESESGRGSTFYFCLPLLNN